MSFSLVSVINHRCPSCSHAHRRANTHEYTNNKLYKLKNTGCYLCNSNITFDKLIPSIVWVCTNPCPEKRFVNFVNHELSLDQKVAFIYISHFTNMNLYLPWELIRMIFKKCRWIETKRNITKVTPELVNHTTQCRSCAEMLVKNNTLYTCHHHIIPRMSEDNF